jgi:hypothetical protein
MPPDDAALFNHQPPLSFVFKGGMASLEEDDGIFPMASPELIQDVCVSNYNHPGAYSRDMVGGYLHA